MAVGHKKGKSKRIISHFAYILRCADDTLYTGYATDINKRLSEHNGMEKGGAKYTRGRRPVEIVYKEKFSSRSAAMKRESEIKQMTRSEKEKLFL